MISPAETARQGTILVIDDEIGPRESLRILFKHEYTVLCADSVDAGLVLLKEKEPDLVLLDIRMPGKNGIEGLREIRQVDQVVSVVILTGFGALETAQQALRFGATDYLTKPFDVQEMRETVNRYVQRTRLERRRARMVEELRQINDRLVSELNTKVELAKVGENSLEIAHDLRNPLMIVSGYVELLSAELEKSKRLGADKYEQISEYLGVIEQNVKRCVELSRMWQRYGKKEDKHFCIMSVAPVIDEVMLGIAPLASTRNVKIQYEIAACNMVINGIQSQLIRAVHNVVANAIDAVREKEGEVWVVCAPSEEGDCVEIRVKDNGCGMPPSVVERIFEPYFTTKGDRDGTGLGLCITKTIVEEHGGKIKVESELNRGTIITIALPLVREEALASEQRT